MFYFLAVLIGGAALFVAGAPLSSAELRYAAAVESSTMKFTVGATMLGVVLLSFVALTFLKRKRSWSLAYAAAAGCLVWAFVSFTNPLRAFNGRSAEVVDLTGLTVDTSAAYITGKVFAYDTRLARASGVYFALPTERRAVRPDEVGTAVRTDCDARRVGRYSDGKAASQFECVLTLIDRARRTIVAKRTFEGGPPPVTKKSEFEESGSLPTAGMTAYLLGLPAK